MRNTIRVKLFLTFLFTTLVIVAGMYVFTRWSLDRGFNELIESRQRERVENLIDSLSEHYASQGGWEGLAGNKPLWIQLLLQSDNRRHRYPFRWIDQASNEPAALWPPELDANHYRNRRWLPLEMRAMLLDARRSLIFGRQELVSELQLHPIESSGQVVGFLGLLPGRPDNQLVDLRFMQRQVQAFAWIALLMLALSALLALLLAYGLGKPIKRIAAAAKRLAVGDYAIRLPVESNDELGQLARDFNEMAAALEQSEQARRRWVADISHELRTPLAVLRGELEALQDGIRPMDTTAVDSLLTDVLRLSRLTDDLYQLALSDQGALSYRKSVLNPKLLLQADLAALLPKFQQKGLQVKWEDDGNTAVELYADADRLSQLFRNLLTNSLNYTESGGCLRIRVVAKAGQWLVEFADTPPGVGEAERAQLFERFYRVEASRSRHHGGAGLGLAICRNIVAAHNGQITAEPSDLGGLAIHIALPTQGANPFPLR